ncbi:MAG: hypothetical protein M1528_03135 [Candidatus Marsarchaeota archaeon]|jgi:hypothetical protein|nr:hypothetical protein [Candidatus Marsarchaeota archaeon]MCL5115501.1 hypothetical protein [Candidatus Marsarchaeota archaeon]
MKKRQGRFVAFVKEDYAFSITTAVIIALVIVLTLSTIHHQGQLQQPSQPTPTTTTPQATEYSVLKNLTYVNLYTTKGHTFVATVPAIEVNSINVSVSSSNLNVNQTLYINVTYRGTFNFAAYNLTAFVKKTVGIDYFGYYQSGSNTMYVYNNRPGASSYFRSTGESKEFTPQGASQQDEVVFSTSAIPTENASGKSWFICGGAFIAFSNDTSWVGAFNNLTYYMRNVDNSTIINKLSGSCSEVHVK